ncbi:unnamed protein product, partial [Didymodactylos carnosus]
MIINIFPIIFLFNFNVAFNPGIIPTNGTTHQLITECALYTITCDYLNKIYKTNIQTPTITNGSCPTSISDSLKQAFKKQSLDWIQYKLTIVYITAKNELVDAEEQTNAPSHFDSESFTNASQLILDRYTSAINAVKLNEFDDANEFFGRMLHTVQDFYSHSNWIELGHRVPHSQLGVSKIIAGIATPSQRTCTNCVSGTSTCENNVDSSILNANLLTSGYFSLLIPKQSSKPKGKCSHGGDLDGTKTFDAIGGINKDTPASVHGYLHYAAAQTAYLATYNTLKQFWNNITDKPFGKFLSIKASILPILLSKSLISSTKLDHNIILQINDSYVYTTLLQRLQNSSEKFYRLAVIVSYPAIDTYYKTHCVAVATKKHITIDIFRNSTMASTQLNDYGYDVSRLTGGLYVHRFNATTAYLNDIQQLYAKQPPGMVQTLDHLTRQRTNKTLAVNIDQTCKQLYIEFVTAKKTNPFLLQLQALNKSPLTPVLLVNTPFYKVYTLENISVFGLWDVVYFDDTVNHLEIRLSCLSDLKCYSIVSVHNANNVHSGDVELHGNIIQGHKAHIETQCYAQSPINDVKMMLVDETGDTVLIAKHIRQHQINHDHWSTKITVPPSKQSFRIKIVSNNGNIQRVSDKLYQTSQIDVSFNLSSVQAYLYYYEHTSISYTM